jgi:hypothetical protein
MNLLECFAGSRSVGKVGDKLGFSVFSIDIKPFEGIDLVADMEFVTVNDIPFIPDVAWFSPPCTTYSIAGISAHRKGIIPVSDFAKKSDRLLVNTVKLIKDLLRLNPDMKFFIENPVGMMRKMPIMKQFDRATVTYCKYGDTRMKPTDIWSNNIKGLFNWEGWEPRPMCFNGNPKCHHERAPRGSKTGTQGLSNDYERSKIPEALCIDILTSCIAKQYKQAS